MPRGGARAGAGRKAPAGKKENHVIRFSDDEWAKIQENARKAGVTVSDYVRRQALNNEEVQ